MLSLLKNILKKQNLNTLFTAQVYQDQWTYILKI